MSELQEIEKMEKVIDQKPERLASQTIVGYKLICSYLVEGKILGMIDQNWLEMEQAKKDQDIIAAAHRQTAISELEVLLTRIRAIPEAKIIPTMEGKTWKKTFCF